MLLSDAWQDLTAQQQALYVVCKAQLYAEKKKPVENDELSFTMNRHKFVEVYKLYSDGNKAGFYRDMRSLINHGFIVCVLSGRITREKSIYRFSSAWRRWGRPEFTIEPGQPVGPKKS